MKPLQEEFSAAPMEYVEDSSDASTPSVDLFAIFAAVVRRWKLITALTLPALMATHGVVKLARPLYQSTVEILVVDPQRQIDGAVQKPISPFVDAIGFEAMNTEINIIKSKSVALRVVKELGLDKDPEFQLRNRLAELAGRFGFPRLGAADDNSAKTIGDKEEDEAEKLDQAADELRRRLQVGQEAYIISVSTTSENPTKAQRIASTIATDYLANQREARQEALQRVATWLKGRVDNLQSRVLQTKSEIEKLKAKSGIRDLGASNLTQLQVGYLTDQMAIVRAEVDEKRARLDQAEKAVAGGEIRDIQNLTTPQSDIQSIPELAASTELTSLRQKQAELNWRAENLQKHLGERHASVIALRAELAVINEQIRVESEHMLGNMTNAYEVAVRRLEALEADLQRLAERDNTEIYFKLQQLERVEDADRQLYDSYLSQYNDISERRTLQDASARIISPATLPRWPTSSGHMKFYALGGMAGLGGGFLLAFLLEYFRPGVRTIREIEQSFGRSVVGIIPLVQHPKVRGTLYGRLLHKIVDDPLSHFSEAVHAMRISLELSSAHSKVVLVTSALPAEGKSTAAMLLAASSASSGKRTVLLDCDLRRHSTSEAFRNERQPGLSELLRGTSDLMDVITKDLATKTYVIPAGSMVPNAADLLMSHRMWELIAELRSEFDYIVMDTSPLLPVLDALVLAAVADKVLVVVAWSQTPRASISEAFKVLRPEAHRVAGVVLNKVDLNQLPEYGLRGGYYYRSVGKHISNA
jgi:capsular exopolysaccharide synthesis family protein